MAFPNQKKYSTLNSISSRRSLVLKNQKGFFQIFGLFFVPILMGSMLAMAQMSYTLISIQKKQHSCLRITLKSQNKLLSILKKLLKMNYRATYLRNKKRTLTLALHAATATGNPPAIAVLRARLIALKIQRVAFRMKQKTLLMSAKMTVRHLQQTLFLKFHPTYSHTPSHGLAVYPSPPYDLTPNYLTLPMFSLKQIITVSWEQSISPLSSWFNKTPISIKRSCSSTLKKRGAQWSTTLNAVKL